MSTDLQRREFLAALSGAAVSMILAPLHRHDSVPRMLAYVAARIARAGRRDADADADAHCCVLAGFFPSISSDRRIRAR